jgi:pimeloyl-ACP methyl ester carboxylesterase
MHTIVTDRDPASIPASPAGRTAVVFIHGIYSDHAMCFGTMLERFRGDKQFDTWDLGWFEYDFHQPIPTSAQLLSQALVARFGAWTEGESVVLVCHSMGGLVARYAALLGGLPFLKKLVMLGTPNFGALRTSKMAIWAQLAMAVGKRLYGVFSRQSGILDLTQVTKVFEGQLTQAAVEKTDPIEYVTIPGLFFNETRGFFEAGDWGEWRGRKNWFAPLRVAAEVLGAYLPLWKIGLEIPHDGIVEESSNRLIPNPGVLGYRSEKTAQIDFPSQFPGHTYVHVIHEACYECTHVTLQHNEDIIRLVADIVLARSLDAWRKSTFSSPRFRAFMPPPRFHKPSSSPHQDCG